MPSPIHLVPVMYSTSQLLLRCLAIVATAVAINAWVIIPAALLLVVFLALRWYYLKTSRDIKRLEAVGGLCMHVTDIWPSLRYCLQSSSSPPLLSPALSLSPSLPPSHQLVVLSTLTYQPHYKGYPPSGYLASRLWHLTTSTNTRMNTHK